MTEINNNLNNIQGITPEIVKAIELYCEGISKMFDNNATVKSNLLKQIKKNFTGLEHQELKGGISGSVSNMSSCILLSSKLEEWNYINTFLHEFTHQIAKNSRIDEEDMQVIEYNLGLKMGQDDRTDSMFVPCSSWTIDGNNYAFDRGAAMMLFDEWITEWLANKFSGLQNVELKTDNNGNFRIKTSHGYDGSNIMNLMELAFGEAQLVDLLLGVTLTEEERNTIIPLKGFQKMDQEFSSELMSNEEKEELVNSSRYIKNPSITIYMSYLIGKYNEEKNPELSNEHLERLMNLLTRLYSQKFVNSIDSISNENDALKFAGQLSVIQNSIIWNNDMDKMLSCEYYTRYVEMVKMLKEKCTTNNIDINLSSLEKTPEEMFEYFSNLEKRYGHGEKKELSGTNKKM